MQKLMAMFCSVRFCIITNTLRGRISVDKYSYIHSKLTSGYNIRGKLTLKNSHIIAKGLTLNKLSEIAADQNGEINLAQDVSIGPRCIISATNTKVEIGANTSFFSDCLISGEISIGEDCLFAKNVSLLSSTHIIDGSGTIRENDRTFFAQNGHALHKKITIGNDCWLGSNVVVLPGVSIGNGVVVGANSVVNKSFPDYAVIAGTPARVIRSRRMNDT